MVTGMFKRMSKISCIQQGVAGHKLLNKGRIQGEKTWGVRLGQVVYELLNKGRILRGYNRGAYVSTYVQFRTLSNLNAMDINAVFNEIKSEHNLDFNLKSEQSEIMELLVEKKSVVATLRTGFGKSLIFMMLPKILDKVRTQFTIFRQAKRGRCMYTVLPNTL